MTPKQKLEELCDKIEPIVNGMSGLIRVNNFKRHVRIIVDEVIKELPEGSEKIEFWNNVKKEAEKL
jgi:hypothetical protein